MVVKLLLTNREYDIITRLNKPNEEISKELGLSVNTINVFVYRLLRKFNVQNRTALIIKLLKHGYVDLNAFD